MPEDPTQKNPHHPYRDAWHKQQSQNMDNAGYVADPLRDHHDRLSALTWNDKEPKKEGKNDEDA